MANVLPIIEVTTLPSRGEFGIDYRCNFEDGGYIDYVWTGDGFQAMSIDTNQLNVFMSTMVEKVQELEEEVFPVVLTSFDMTITSLMQTELDLYTDTDEVVPNQGMSVEVWEEPQEVTYQNEVRKGTYYLKNEDGYALGTSGGELVPIVVDGTGSTVDLGAVELIMLTTGSAEPMIDEGDEK